MGANRLEGIGAEGPISIRKILRENKAEEWTEVLEGHGVYSVDELRRVKYADLVQFGITEFEPRKRIFELIKQLNTEHPYEPERRASIHQRMQSFSRYSTGFNIKTPEIVPVTPERYAYNRESIGSRPGNRESIGNNRVGSRESVDHRMMEGLNRPGNRESVDPMESVDYSGRRMSVIKEGYSPGSIWKKKKDMVNEIIQEAEDSIIFEEDPLCTSEQETEIEARTSRSLHESMEYPSVTSVDDIPEDQTGIDTGIDTRMNTGVETSRITVIVRKRPMKLNGKRDTVTVDGQKIVLNERKQKIDLTPYMEPHIYTFDRAYGERSTTEEIYRESIEGLVEYALNGGSSTCIAYGQTGSGKTYTMLNEETGMIFLALNDLLVRSVQLSFYEIYSNSIFDLLDERKKIFAREKDGVVSIVGVKEYRVSTIQEATRLIRKGLQCRMTGKTGANSNSSRSHALVRIKTAEGMFTFVDLAGSERGTERGTESQQSLIKREGAEINKSLLALKECIRAMDKSAAHLPFRHSKLTQVLKESLVGEAKCCIIATISPEEVSTEHSLNTLRYAHRIRGLGLKEEVDRPKTATVQNKPVKNAQITTEERARAQRNTQITTEEKIRAQKIAVEQALAAAASRIARERDPGTLEVLKEALMDISRYKRTP